jgi:hypothetical protein
MATEGSSLELPSVFWLAIEGNQCVALALPALLLAVIDEYTRECLAIEMARSFTAQDVLGVLQYHRRGTETAPS